MASFVVIAIGYFVEPFKSQVTAMHEFHFLGAVFVTLLLIMLAVGKVAPRPEAFVQQDVKAVDMTPWKHARITGGILCIIVLIIYAVFADFSVLK